MKAYVSLFRIRFIGGLQYRAVLIGSILMRFAWVLMEILAYSALYRVNARAFPLTFSQIVSYVWLQQTLFVFFSVVFSDGDIYSSISDGSISYALTRPLNLYNCWFCQSAANRVSFSSLNCAPVLLVALLIPKPYGLAFVQNSVQFLLFLVSLALTLPVVVALAMLMYISLFYMISQRGVRIIVTALASFLSGGVIPLTFFPEPIYAVIRYLPFAAMQNMPLRIYCGDLSGVDAVTGIAFQAVWLIVLVLIGRRAMRRALQKVVAQGG